MPASVRMSASAFWMIASKVFDRWLISITDMPTPGSATRSRCASSSTGSGSTAGPAAKLKMRCTDMDRDSPGRLVDGVRRLAVGHEGLNDADGLGRDGFLRLIGRRADVMRAVDARRADDRVGEIATGLRRFLREDVEADAQLAIANGRGQGRV